MNIQEALEHVRKLLVSNEDFEAFGLIEAGVPNGFVHDEADLQSPVQEAAPAEEAVAEAPADAAPAEEAVAEAPADEAPAEDVPAEDAVPAE